MTRIAVAVWAMVFLWWASLAVDVLAADVDPIPLGGDRYAIPLIGKAPAWWTAEVAAKALAAGEQGMAYDVAEDRYVAAAAYPPQVLVRPGSQLLFARTSSITSVFLGWCTAGFVFSSGTKISTAGHCTEPGDYVFAVSAPSTVLSIGRTSSDSDGGLGNDWALITLNSLGLLVTDADVAWVGGPCGEQPKNVPPLVPLLKLTGHAAGIGTGGTPRTGVFLSYSGEFTAAGPAYSGDSGSPVLETTAVKTSPPCAAGAAFGILTHVIGVGVGPIEVIGVGVGPIDITLTGLFFGTQVSVISGTVTDADFLPANVP